MNEEVHLPVPQAPHPDPSTEATAFEALCLVLAMITLPLLHHDIGYRRAPLQLLIFVLCMLCLSTLFWHSTLLLCLGGLGFLSGVWQHLQSHAAVKAARPGPYTLGTGTPWLEALPLGFLKREARLSRYIEPLLLLAAGLYCCAHLDMSTGIWLVLSGCGMRVWEATEYRLFDQRRSGVYDAGLIGQGMHDYQQTLATTTAQAQPAQRTAALARPLPTTGEDYHGAA
jgi:hypothetical protein